MGKWGSFKSERENNLYEYVAHHAVDNIKYNGNKSLILKPF
jgi:hypothetical protein